MDLITGKLDLFMALSVLKKEDEVQDMVLNLISYLLVNQMLFYHHSQPNYKQEHQP